MHSRTLLKLALSTLSPASPSIIAARLKMVPKFTEHGWVFTTSRHELLFPLGQNILFFFVLLYWRFFTHVFLSISLGGYSGMSWNRSGLGKGAVKSLFSSFSLLHSPYPLLPLHFLKSSLLFSFSARWRLIIMKLRFVEGEERESMISFSIFLYHVTTGFFL